MADAPLDDERLLAAACLGDGHALELLLFRRYDTLLRLVSSKIPASLQSLLDAEDILQQTFAQAFRDFDKSKPASLSLFAAWVKTIAENRLRDTIKSLKRKKRGGEFRRVADQGSSRSSSMAELADFLSDSGPTPSGIVARDEAVQAIEIALAALPADYHEVIRLRFFEGKSVDETAAAMQRTPGAVRGLLDRAKDQLRAALGRMSLYLSR